MPIGWSGNRLRQIGLLMCDRCISIDKEPAALRRVEPLIDDQLALALMAEWSRSVDPRRIFRAAV